MKSKSLSNRRTSRRIPATLCAFAFAAMAGQSYAQSLQIGVNFVGRNAPTALLGANEFAGFVPQQDWNNLGVNLAGEPSGDFSNTAYTNRTSGFLFADDGLADTRATSGVTVTVSAADSWSSDGPTTTPDQRLMKGIIKAKTDNPLTLTLSGLTAGANYTFLAYSQENNGTGDVNFSLSGNTVYGTYFVRQSSSFDGTFTKGISTDAAARTAGVDYVQWDTVAANADGKLTLTVSYLGNGSDGGGLAGFQLLEIVPPGADKFYNFGAGAGVFDTTTTSWRATNDAGPSNAAFATRDNAVFGNLGTAGDRNVTVAAGGVEVGALTVNNAAGNNYTIGGEAIRGAKAAFVKDGDGSLTLTGANEFTGGVIIKHGTVNVSTIGDNLAAGNLGKGATIALGDTVVGSPAVLNYTGSTATVNRAVSIAQTGATIAVPSGVTLSMGNLTGSGDLTKGGTGGVSFVGSAGNFSGGINVPTGALSIGSMGRGTNPITLSATGVASFTYGGQSLNDGRAVTTGPNATTITVANVNARYQVPSFTPNGGAVTIAGPGRLAIAGQANFSGGLPTLAPGATLALQNESTTTPNTVPAGPITIAANTILEVAPGALGSNTTGTYNLNGGTIRLAHEGLLLNVFQGGVGTVNDYSGTLNNVTEYFGRIVNTAPGANPGDPVITLPAGTGRYVGRTNFDGRTDLNFSNTNYGATAPFAPLSPDLDNIRSFFTGKILITAGGDTTFFTTSDDGSALFIDGQRVVANNAFQGQTNRQGIVNLTPGLHDIAIYYYEGGGGAGLNVEYTPVGGARQSIPNSVLFAGDVYNDTSRNVNLNESSTLETGGTVNLGALSHTGGKTLTTVGNVNFASTTLTGTGSHGITTGSRSIVNLGTTTGTTKTIDKSGSGALLFSNAAPTGLTINVDGGLVVNQASFANTDPLGSTTLNFNGGGLGLSSIDGDATFTRNIVTANDYRVEAGRFRSPVDTAMITWAPANNSVTVAAGKTATFTSRDSGFNLDVSAPVAATGAIVVEEGKVNFNGASFSSGSLTVNLAEARVSAPITTGALSVTSSLVQQGVAGNPIVTGTSNRNVTGLAAESSVTASSVTVNGGVLNVGGNLTNSGALTLTGGATTLNANATNASVSVAGATLLTSGNLVSTGALTVAQGGAVTVTGTTTASNIALSENGQLTVSSNVSSPGGTTMGAGSTLVLNPFEATTYSGGISANQGTVHAQSGSTDLGSAPLTFAPYSVQAGLLEGFVNSGDLSATGAGLTTVNTGQERPGSTESTGGVQLFPRMGQTNSVNASRWGDNMTWVYTGQFYDADGIFTFGENIDDDTRLFIDSRLALSSGCCGEARSSATGDANAAGTNDYGMGPNGDGWHTFEVRFRNGGGGAGSNPTTANWGVGDSATFSRIGFGLNASGTTSTDRIAGGYVIPVDPGNASLFRVTSGGGTVRVDAGATLKVGSTTGSSLIRLNGFQGAPAVFEIADNAQATANTGNSIRITDAFGEGTVKVGSNNTLEVGGINLASDSVLTKSGVGTLRVTGDVEENPAGPSASSFGTGRITVTEGTLVMNAVTSGTGGISASVAGTLAGNGTISGPVSILSGATLTPGDGVGKLGTGDLSLVSGAKLQLQLTGSALVDQLQVSGGVSLGNSTLLTSAAGFNGAVNDVFYIILNDGADAVTGTFNGLANLSSFTADGFTFQISYNSDSLTGAAGFGAGGNDVAMRLTAVPEPSAVAILIGGFGTLLGLQRFRRRNA